MDYCKDLVKPNKKPSHAIGLFLALTGTLLVSLGTVESSFCKSNVYKQVLPNGQVEYSDRPTQESTVVNLPSIQVNSTVESKLESKAEAESVAGTKSEEAKNQKQEQISLRISSPLDQQYFIATVTDVPVTFIVEPELKPNQKIKLWVDNKPYGEPQNSTDFVLKNLERGAHELKGVVIEASGTVLATSAPVTFFQQRQSVRKK